MSAKAILMGFVFSSAVCAANASTTFWWMKDGSGWRRTGWNGVAALLIGVGAVAAQTPSEPMPPRSFQRFGTANLRHGSRILCLAYSQDGEMLAAGGGNDPVRIWDPKTGAIITA